MFGVLQLQKSLYRQINEEEKKVWKKSNYFKSRFIY
jgi:hypothetical protein